MALANNSTTLFTFGDGGSLGVGTNSPSSSSAIHLFKSAPNIQLQDSNNTIAQAGYTSNIEFTDSAGARAFFIGDDSAGSNNLVISNAVSGNDSDIVFIAGGSHRLRIENDGTFYLGNGSTSATPTAPLLQATGGSGTDIAGANLMLAGGRGTGTGAGGSILFQTSAVGGTGSSLNSLSTVLTLQGGTGAATFQNVADSTSGFRVLDADGGTSIFNIDTTNERVGVGDDTPDFGVDIAGAPTSENLGRLLNVEATTTDSAFSQFAALIALDVNPSVASTEEYVATASAAITSGANLANGILSGSSGVVYNNGTDTLGTGIGLQGTISNGSTGTITNAIAIQANSGIAGSGTITNNYGILVQSQTAGVNNYGVVIGDAGTNTLWVNNTNDSTDEAGGIVFGSSRDVNLYRGASNVLKTDDSLHVVDRMQIGPDATVGSIDQCNMILGFVNCTAGLEAGAASTETTNMSFGLRGLLTINPASASSGNSAALSGVAGVLGTQNITGSIRGIEGSALSINTGTLSSIMGIWGNVNIVAGTATDAYGIQASVTNTGTITNAYGLDIQSATGTITTNYGLRVAAQTAGTSDYGIGIGAADTQTLWVNNTSNSTNAAGGIAFGSSRDTNLYRSAANTLRTDDALVTVGTISKLGTGTNVAVLLTNGTNSSGTVQLNRNGTSNGTLSADTGDNGLILAASGTTRDLVFQTNGSTALTIQETGQSQFASNISAGYTSTFQNSGGAADRYGIQIQAGANDGSGTTYYLNALDGDGDQVGYIANDGGTFGITDVSDARTKTNISDTGVDGLAVINALSVKDYNRLSNPDGDIITGFIAQEVLDVYGQAVTIGPDGMYGIRKDAFIPVLVKGVQELDQKVSVAQGAVSANDLKIIDIQSQVDSLEAQVAGLQTQVDALNAAQSQQSAPAPNPTFVESTISLGVQNVAVADSGNAGAPTSFSIVPTASYVEVTCADADGCEATFDVSAASQGFSVFMINVGASPVTVLDAPGVAELAGNFVMGAYDSLSTFKVADRWVEISRSDN